MLTVPKTTIKIHTERDDNRIPTAVEILAPSGAVATPSIQSGTFKRLFALIKVELFIPTYWEIGYDKQAKALRITFTP